MTNDFQESVADSLEQWTTELDSIDTIRLHGIIAACVLQLAKRIGPARAAQAVHDLAFSIVLEVQQ